MLFISIIIVLLTQVSSYRLYGSNETLKFEPYEEGFVGKRLDPKTYHGNEVNPGFDLKKMTLEYEVDSNRLQTCPGMIGPIEDNKYYCLGKHAGYCDRRTGTCFCNTGYTGLSCEKCSPSHISVGSLCYPKKLCLNDCSGNGECDFLTGRCTCFEHREGRDCSLRKCSKFHEYCVECDDNKCVECVQGYSVHSSGCLSCARLDPRCKDCDEDKCLSCADLLLKSVKRAGPRHEDMELPKDELERELSVLVPFGSQQVNAFDEAEVYFVVNEELPLKDRAVACHQGLNMDARFTCTPKEISHVVCGHYGTVSFSSPEYGILENAGHIRVTVVRSGGGVGRISVSYIIQHISTDDGDVTPTARYTSNQEIVFEPGQIEKSFLVAIHDDRKKESNETFLVILSDPSDKSTLGNQFRAVVTIFDDDHDKTCSASSVVTSSQELGHLRAIAGEPSTFTITAKSCLDERQLMGGDSFAILLTSGEETEAPRIPYNGKVVDLGDGTYSCTVNATKSGKYDLHVYQLIPGGLRGYYFSDFFLSHTSLEKIRIDPVINSTWGEGRITNFGRDFVSVKWEGFLLGKSSEKYTFLVDFDDYIRIWLDGVLLIDQWDQKQEGRSMAQYQLMQSEFYALRIEFGELKGEATARLLWSSERTSLEVVPDEYLYYEEDVKGSPFRYTVISGEVNASTSVASGPGLFGGISGKEHHFTITPKDSFGNFRGDYDAGYDGKPAFLDKNLDPIRQRDNFHAVATLTENDGGGYGLKEIFVSIVYNHESRKYDASFLPTRSGLYSCNVTLLLENGSNDVAADSHIFGSPFIINTMPDVTFAMQSDVYGGYWNCVEGGVVRSSSGTFLMNKTCSQVNDGMAGHEQYFFIESFDFNHNRRNQGGDQWEIIIRSLVDQNSYQYGHVEDLSNGVYSAYFTPAVSGSNELSVLLDGIHARGSPFELLIRPDVAYGPSSFVITDLNSTTIIATANNYFTVQTVDRWGNYLDSNAGPYETDVKVFISSKTDADAVAPRRTFFPGDGTFRVRFVPMKAGLNMITVKVNGKQISGSPFKVDVIPGNLVGSASTATGAGLTNATAGEEAEFVIQARDRKGNPRSVDGDNFVVTLTIQTFSSKPAFYERETENVAAIGGQVDYIDNGKYLVKYNATVSGAYKMDVTTNDSQHIVGSPFSVVVNPDATSALKTIVDGRGSRIATAGENALVRIFARDSYGNFALTGGDKILCRLKLKTRHEQWWEAKQQEYAKNKNDLLRSNTLDAIVTGFGNGWYRADYIPTVSGEYEMHVTMDKPGGLWGSYFKVHDFDWSHLVFIQNDSQLNKAWEFRGPAYEGSPLSNACVVDTSQNSPAEEIHECVSENRALSLNKFSVEWKGAIEADHSEEYTIGVKCDEGGKTEVIIDEIEIIKWDSCFGLESGYIVMKPGERVNIRIRYSHESENAAFFILKWFSPSIGAFVTIPAANLYREVLVSGRTYTPVIYPNVVHPPMSTAIGRAINEGVSGVMQSFIVECRDGFGNGEWGNLQLSGGTLVNVLARAGSSSADPRIDGIVSDNNNGTYTVDYFPVSSGTYYLTISVVDRMAHKDLGYYAGDMSIASSHVKSSPFLLKIFPGKTDPRASLLNGVTEIDAKAGVERILQMHARDTHENRRDIGGDIVVAYISTMYDGENDVILHCEVNDMDDGTYLVKFTPRSHAGKHHLHVAILGDDGKKVDIMGSPYNITIYPSAPNASKTHIESGATSTEGNLWSFISRAGNRREFEVIARDEFDNAFWEGGANFAARIRGNTNVHAEELLLGAYDNGDGSYKFSYKINEPDHYEIDIRVAHRKGGLLGSYYRNRYLSGEPSMTRIDAHIDFNWGYSRIIDTTADFLSIRWSGYLKTPHTDKYLFELAHVNDHAILWIEDSLVVDTKNETKGHFSCVGNVLYKIRIEFFETDKEASISFLWSSQRTPKHRVPSNYLFSEVEPIMGSPFELNVI